MKTPCSALVTILWFLVVIYFARSSAKCNPFPSSPNIPLITTRKRVMLSTPSYWILSSVYLLSDVVPSTLTLIYLSLISFLMNSIICPVFLCSLVVCMVSFCWFQRRMHIFSPFFYFRYCICCASLQNCLLSIFLFLQVSNQSHVCHLFKYLTKYIGYWY